MSTTCQYPFLCLQYVPKLCFLLQVIFNIFLQKCGYMKLDQLSLLSKYYQIKYNMYFILKEMYRNFHLR